MSLAGQICFFKVFFLLFRTVFFFPSAEKRKTSLPLGWLLQPTASPAAEAGKGTVEAAQEVPLESRIAPGSCGVCPLQFVPKKWEVWSSGKNPPLCSGIAASQLKFFLFLNLISSGGSAGISRGPLLVPSSAEEPAGAAVSVSERILA